jgi:1-acyl-sn-glycerol-3-phosphate acyltransferase
MKKIFVQVIVGTMFLLVLLIVLMPPVLIASLAKRDQAKKIMFVAWLLFSRIILAVVTLTKVTKIDKRKSSEKNIQTIFASNHQSLMDIPMFAAIHQVAPLMKAEILSYPIIGPAAKLSGAITVKRKSDASKKAAFKQCIKNMRAGESLVYYPEGTRSKDFKPKKLSDINTPIMATAYKMKIPVTPVTVFGTKDIIGDKGQVSFFVKAGIITHSPVHPEHFETVDEFLVACWDKVHEGYEDLRLRLT